MTHKGHVMICVTLNCVLVLSVTSSWQAHYHILHGIPVRLCKPQQAYVQRLLQLMGLAPALFPHCIACLCCWSTSSLLDEQVHQTKTEQACIAVSDALLNTIVAKQK